MSKKPLNKATGILLLLSLFAIAHPQSPAGAGTQGSDNGTTYYHSVSKKPAKSVFTNDTRKLFPQIVSGLTSKGIKPENPKSKTGLKAGEPNALSEMLGQTSGQSLFSNLSRFPGIGFTGAYPPDPHIAAGPTHVVQVVNTRIAFFRKSDGVKIFDQPMENPGFYSGVTGVGTFVFDPKVIFDPDTNRFIALALDVDFNTGVSQFEISVSDDADPTGVWHHYVIDNTLFDPFGNPFWGDYPSLGVNKDYLAVTTNVFAFAGGAPPASVQVQVMDKAPMLTGDSVTADTIFMPDFTVQLCKKSAPGGTRPVYGLALESFGSSAVYAIYKTAEGPEVARASVAVPNFSGAPGLALANDNGLDTIGERNMDLSALDNDLVYAHTVGNQTQSFQLRSKVRWVELDANEWPAKGTPSFRQAGDIAYPGNASALMPAICKTVEGAIVAVFTHCSDTLNPRLAVAVRRPIDLPGTMGAPADLANSPGFPGQGFGMRWGDYAGAVIDPSDPKKVWGCTELLLNGNLDWSTAIVGFTVNQTIVNGTISPLTVTPVLGTVNSGTTASFSAIDGNTYNMTSVVDGRGVYSSFDLTFQGTVPVANLRQYDGTISLTADKAGVTGFVYMWNYTTSKWTLLATKRLGMNVQTQMLTAVGESDVANYIETGTNQIKMRIATFQAATKNGGAPPVHISATDLVKIEQVKK